MLIIDQPRQFLYPARITNLPDVTVIGGGLAGLAATLHLAKAGLRVVCIEPRSGARQPVGESLDWSTPGLLAGLGISPPDLLDPGFATWKRGVTLRLKDGSAKKYFPRDWLGRPPFNVELSTLHVDRAYLDQHLINLAAAQGVVFSHDHAASIERDGSRILAVRTALGERLTSPWFIDASGYATSLLAREFGLESIAYGVRKVAIWTYFAVPASGEGTTICIGPDAGDCVEWLWEIPITPSITSVGFVATADHIKERRKLGQTVEDILSQQLSQSLRFAELLAAGWTAVPRTVTFACRTYKDVAGLNWLIAGEAASLVDPITSNGVTAALRHARDAAEIIIAHQGRLELSPKARRLYSRRVAQLSTFFNCGIEKLVYDWPVRRRIGIQRAARLYTVGAWVMNALYSRVRPRGTLATATFGGVLASLKAGARCCHALCRWTR